LGVALLLLAAAQVHAGEITAMSWYSGVASVAGEIIVSPSAPNNDDQAGTSPNVVFVLQKNYLAIGPVDLVFDVVSTGGVTEYAIVEGVNNSTGIDWSGYHLELGYGIGDDFVKSTAPDGLDFDAPDYNSLVDFGAFFPSSVSSEHDIIADGTQPNLAYADGITFHIDVPDGISSFTLRQSPIPVPEPSTALLLIGAGLIRRRSARS
jgi:hypothetical protein